MRKILYRVDEHAMLYRSIEDNLLGEVIVNANALVFKEYEVIRQTVASYMIYENGTPGIGRMLRGNIKRVPKLGKNLFAFDNKQDAVKNFVLRKKKQRGYAKTTIKKIDELLKQVELWDGHQ